MIEDRDVLDNIESELLYGRTKWDENRPDGSNPDEEKSIETWILWAEQELKLARDSAYQGYDKTKAAHHCRKAAAHLANALKYHGNPTR